MKNIKYYELTKLFKNLRKNQIILLILCTTAVSFSLYFTYQIQELVDLIVSGAKQSIIVYMFIKMVLLGFVTFVLGIIQTRQWHIFRYKVMNQMRITMYEKLLSKEAIFYDEHTTGDVVSAIMTDGSLIAQCAGLDPLMFFLNAFQIVVIVAVLFRKNYLIGIVEIVAGLAYFISINIINKKMRNHYKDFSKETADLNQMIVENTKAIFEIKTLNEKQFFCSKFKHQIWSKYFIAAKNVIGVDVLSYAANQFINIMFPVFILIIGGLFTYRGLITIGVVILFYTYTQKMVEPLNNLSDFYRGTQMAVGAADRVYKYLFEKTSKVQKNNIKKSNNISLSIHIHSFAWKKNETIITNIHEEYFGGDKIFVQGESGTGKSTLLKLICGFYNISDGNIQINGCNIKEMQEEQIFDNIKIQFQEPIILEGTIRENIKLGKEFSENEIMEAIKMVNLNEFIEINGLDYQITENGKNLSGGQKQRLELARLILRKPPILILDEATSALDEKNEKEIIKNINQFVEKNKSILIVTSHRDSFKQICNKVLVLKK